MDFSNTAIAFSNKSNRELSKAWWLFKIISLPPLVKIGNALMNLAIQLHFPINWMVKPTLFHQFAGGESVIECAPTVEKLAVSHIKSILDYSVEGTKLPQGIQHTLNETLFTIRNAGGNINIPFAVFKPTAFTSTQCLQKITEKLTLTPEENEDYKKFKKCVEILCQTAADNHLPLMIDAEDFCYQFAIDEVVLTMMKQFNRDEVLVYTTLQLYRTDRLDYLHKISLMAKNENFKIGLKLVRGAYMEKERERARKMGYPSPIYPFKSDTDLAFDQAVEFCTDNIDHISLFCGTHNEKSSLSLCQHIDEKNFDKNDTRIYFGQLFGMSDHISYNLAHKGFNVAKYIPYGPVEKVIPYLSRRAAENTSVKGQTGRELTLLTQEIKRRKNKKNGIGQ